MKELTGTNLLKKIKSQPVDTPLNELAILCGYSFESTNVNGEQIIKAKRKKFVDAVINAGGKVDPKWLVDPYASQRRYIAKNKDRKAIAQQKWTEKNQDKIKKLRETEEYKQKNREHALNAYYRRIAKEKAVEQVLT